MVFIFIIQYPITWTLANSNLLLTHNITHYQSVLGDLCTVSALQTPSFPFIILLLLFPVLCFQLSVQCTTGTPGNKLKTILSSLWRFKLSGFHCLYIWQLLILPAYCMTFLWLCKHFRDIHKKYCMTNSFSAMFDTFVLDFCIFIHSSPHNKFPDLPGHHVDWPAAWRREANHWFPLLLLLHYFVV